MASYHSMMAWRYRASSAQGLTLVDLSPETVLEGFLGLLQLLLVLEAIQVGQHPHHLGEAMHLRRGGLGFDASQE